MTKTQGPRRFRRTYDLGARVARRLRQGSSDFTVMTFEHEALPVLRPGVQAGSRS